jgi:cytochrome c6
MKPHSRAAAIITLFLFIVTAVGLYSMESAQSIYQERCSACHGRNGDANTWIGKKYGALGYQSPAVVKMSDAELATIIKNGKGKMPSFADKLSDAQIQELVKYIRTLK